MSPFILILGGGVALAILGAVVFLVLRGGDKELRQRLRRVSEPLSGGLASADSEEQGDIFRTVSARPRSGRVMTRIQARYPLLDAGRAVPRALALAVAGGVGSWVTMWGLQIPLGWWTWPLVGAATIASWFYAMSWFHGRQIAEFNRQFPEVIDQIVRLSRAGVPALEAIAVITEDTRPPIEPVLRDVCEGLLAGLDTDTALRTVSARIRLAEFTLFTSVIRLQRRSGGSVSAAFANLSNTLRERRSTALKARASTAQTRLTLLVLSVMPVLVLVGQKFIAPKSVDMLFGTQTGNSLLHWGVGLIVAGLLVAKFMSARAQQ